MVTDFNLHLDIQISRTVCSEQLRENPNFCLHQEWYCAFLHMTELVMRYKWDITDIFTSYKGRKGLQLDYKDTFSGKMNYWV